VTGDRTAVQSQQIVVSEKNRLRCETEVVSCCCCLVQTVGDRLQTFGDVETDAVLTVDEDVDLVTDEARVFAIFYCCCCCYRLPGTDCIHHHSPKAEAAFGPNAGTMKSAVLTQLDCQSNHISKSK